MKCNFTFIMDIGLKIAVLTSLFHCVCCITNVTVVESRVLSRKKRYLLFPEGSSLQLVFCVQANALIAIQDIFLFGQTAAFAWTLPTDPAIFHTFKEEKVAQRRQDELQQNIYYLDKKGQVIAKVPQKRPAIHSVFSKRSVDDRLSYKNKLKQLKVDRSKMHEKQLTKDYLKKHHMDKISIEFHRSSRLSLLEKLETFFSALGQDGRRCVLYRLCQAGKDYTQQGTFLQEIFRVIFTLPKGPEAEEYDVAHAAKDCDKLYTCDDFSDTVEL